MVKYYVDIERPSGTFTAYYNGNVNRSAAHQECAKHGQILAPITEKEDFDAIVAVLSAENEENILTGRDWWQYLVGLEVAYDNSHKIFTNGVEFDEEKHGSWYENDKHNKLEGNCPLALLWPGNPTSILIRNTWCEVVEKMYICFKPKNRPCASSDSVVGKINVGNTEVKSFTYAGFGTCTLVIFAIYFVFSLYKRTKNISENK